jgi:predicted secreted acid phosphatase
MEKEKITKIVKDATLKHLPHAHPYKVADLEETLIETLSQALGKSDVRTSCLRECWEMWLQSKDEKDFIRWLLGQLA